MFFAAVVFCVSAGAQTVSIRFPASVSNKALDGRVLLLLSNDPSDEPRMQIDDSMKSQQVFGVTVDGMKAGQVVVVGDGAAGPVWISEDESEECAAG